MLLDVTAIIQNLCSIQLIRRYLLSIPARYINQLTDVLSKRCEGWIPRPGEDAENVNCYSVYVRTGESDQAYYLHNMLRTSYKRLVC